ncbi:hypothetical protein COOONC_05027, partial [Cooperia oncophora]
LNQSSFIILERREDRLERIRDGEESSDDDLFEEDIEVKDEERWTVYERQLIERMRRLRIQIDPERLANMVSEMIARIHIHTTQSSRERMPSPPRSTAEETAETIDLPWCTGDEGGDDEVLEEIVPADNEKPKIPIGQNVYVYDWSETLFPDEEAAIIGEKRPLNLAEEIGKVSNTVLF